MVQWQLAQMILKAMAKDTELYVMKIDYGREYPMHYLTKFIKGNDGYTLTSPNRKNAMKAPFLTIQEIRECLLRKQIMYKDYPIKEGDITIEKADVPKKRQWHRKPWHREPWHNTIKN